MVTKIKGSRKIAIYSLIIMGVGFIATTPFKGPILVDLLHGGFEAGLVGGLADWFAVTALFRHPLGIPIPHTALLPNNRKRVTNGLVTMLKKDWLSKESILEKVKHIPFTDKLSIVIEKKITTETFRKGLMKLFKKLIGSINVEKMTPFVKKQIKSALADIDISPIITLISQKLLNEEIEKKALDHTLNKVELYLKKEQTGQKLGAVSMNVLNNIEADGILQFALKSIQSILNEEKLGNIVQNLLLSVVKGLKQEGDPNREALMAYIRKEIQGASDNQELLEGVEKWKHQLLEKWEPDQTIAESLKRIQQNIVDLTQEETFMDTYLMPMIHYLLDLFKNNHPAIDPWIQNQIAILVENNHEHIGDLVQENLDKLDNNTLVDMVENNIGKDLQWIRVNGAVCGFVIGIFLTGIQILSTFW
jgi:uncharacterized membrane-anchored protein YjiN (DUF445 family)